MYLTQPDEDLVENQITTISKRDPILVTDKQKMTNFYKKIEHFDYLFYKGLHPKTIQNIIQIDLNIDSFHFQKALQITKIQPNNLMVQFQDVDISQLDEKSAEYSILDEFQNLIKVATVLKERNKLKKIEQFQKKQQAKQPKITYQNKNISNSQSSILKNNMFSNQSFEEKTKTIEDRKFQSKQKLQNDAISAIKSQLDILLTDESENIQIQRKEDNLKQIIKKFKKKNEQKHKKLVSYQQANEEREQKIMDTYNQIDVDKEEMKLQKLMKEKQFKKDLQEKEDNYNRLRQDQIYKRENLKNKLDDEIKEIQTKRDQKDEKAMLFQNKIRNQKMSKLHSKLSEIDEKQRDIKSLSIQKEKQYVMQFVTKFCHQKKREDDLAKEAHQHQMEKNEQIQERKKRIKEQIKRQKEKNEDYKEKVMEKLNKKEQQTQNLMETKQKQLALIFEHQQKINQEVKDRYSFQKQQFLNQSVVDKLQDSSYHYASIKQQKEKYEKKVRKLIKTERQENYEMRQQINQLMTSKSKEDILKIIKKMDIDLSQFKDLNKKLEESNLNE